MDLLDRDPDPRRLLDAYRDGERMPPARREAAWLRLQAAIRAEEHGAPVTTELRSAPRGPDRRRVAWVGALLLAAALILLFSGLRGLVYPHTAAPTDSQAAHDAREGPPARAHAPALAPTPVTREVTPGDGASASGAGETSTASTPGATVDAAGSAPSSAGAAPASSSAGSARSGARNAAPARGARGEPAGPAPAAAEISGLDAELSLLRRARAALSTAAPGQALALLDEHARRFGSGHLVEERMLLRVQALCAVGERAQARAAARVFARTHPGSPHTPTITTSCPE